ncbi:hypothetical protein F5Y10DRAFT_242712 [Nemania abortiva]|nr:hypothetical protein F5Y10DRAFT_242712 [Nemania abortiva]
MRRLGDRLETRVRTHMPTSIHLMPQSLDPLLFKAVENMHILDLRAILCLYSALRMLGVLVVFVERQL